MTFPATPSAPYYKDVHSRGFLQWSPLSVGALLATAVFVTTAVTGCNRGDRPAQVGRQAHDFTVSDGSNTIQLSHYRGKIVLLNFWASWCAPCVQETPALLQLHRDFPDIEIVGVSIDTDADAYRHFIRRYGINYATVMDPQQKAARLYHTDGWPETYIIDRQGVIRRKVVGDPDWSNPEIRAFLKSL